MTEKWSRAVLRGLGSSNAPRLPDHIFRNTQPSDRRLVGTFVRPADKCLKRMKLKVKEMTSRRTLSDDAIRKIQAINAAVRGWAAYYRAVNPTETFKELDRYVWLRLSIWFRKKYRISPKQMQKRFMHRKEGPKGGRKDYAVWDEGTGRWLWRYLAQETKLVYHRPSFKKHWPHPYLESVKVERYVLPTLKEVWTGITRAPIYEATRRVVLKRAEASL
jgi:RNA-directed DNA polymerase